MNNVSALELMTSARMRMLLNDFFFGRLALYLQFREDPSCPTLAVDGESIFFNPDFIRTLDDKRRTAAVAHELCHCVLEHISRRGVREPVRWNCATDFVVNAILKESGYELGQGWLYDPKFAGMTAEQVYDLLPETESSGGGGGQGKPNGGALCEVRNAAPTASPQEAETKLRWQVAVQAAAIETSKRAGKLSPSLQRLVDDINKPQVPWQQVLQRWCTELLNDDYSWSRPLRKFAAHGLYLPGMRSEGMGTLGVIADTSGSINKEVFDAFVCEIRSMANMVRPKRIVYMAADDRVHEEIVFDGELQPSELRATGCGGTDFRPALEAMEKYQPSAVVYLTDLYGECGEERDFPVLWTCTTDQKAPWGETLPIKV